VPVGKKNCFLLPFLFRTLSSDSAASFSISTHSIILEVSRPRLSLHADRQWPEATFRARPPVSDCKLRPSEITKFLPSRLVIVVKVGLVIAIFEIVDCDYADYHWYLRKFKVRNLKSEV